MEIHSGMSFGDIAEVARKINKINPKRPREIPTLDLVAILADRCEELQHLFEGTTEGEDAKLQAMADKLAVKPDICPDCELPITDDPAMRNKRACCVCKEQGKAVSMMNALLYKIWKGEV